jgi:hypothetical protein
MKMAISIGVAVVMPFGFVMLAGVIVNHVLVKRRQTPRGRLQIPYASSQGDRTGQTSSMPLCNVEFERAAA